MPNQLFVLGGCASASSSGFPANSGLNLDQFNCSAGPGYSGWAAGCTGGEAGFTGGVPGCAGCAGGAAGSAGATGSGCGICGPPSAIFIYVLCRNDYKQEKDCLILYLTEL